MTSIQTVDPTSGAPPFAENREENRSSVACDLWMIDHNGSTVLRCHCTDMSKNGMRLRVPLGYGVAEGQRYELRSHLPGDHPASGFDVIGSRWATVAWTELKLGQDDDHLAIGLILDRAASALNWSAVNTVVS